VRSGVVTGLSVGFRLLEGGSRRGADGVIERRRAHVDHVALTHSPAYAGAEVVALRGAGAGELGGGRPLATWRRTAERLRRVLDD
jgi:phage head maturation protease